MQVLSKHAYRKQMISLFKKDNLIHSIFVLLQAVLLGVILFADCEISVFCFCAVALAVLHALLYFKGKEQCDDLFEFKNNKKALTVA